MSTLQRFANIIQLRRILYKSERILMHLWHEKWGQSRLARRTIKKHRFSYWITGNPAKQYFAREYHSDCAYHTKIPSYHSNYLTI